MRGKVGGGMRFKFPFGITPAYAGKSIEERNPSDYVLGSPPPMRGKVHESPACTCGKGITPAYAGKRQRFNAATSGTEDHPRLCGEKASPLLALNMVVGSPPPMRGKVFTLCG